MSNKNENRNVLDVLIERGFVDSAGVDGEEKLAVTSVLRAKALLDQGTTIYEGFDPSGPSLHLGHLLSIMALHYLQDAGNKIIFLLGGATGRIGDPSGKISERVLLSEDQVKKNGKALKNQVQKIGLLDFNDPKKAVMVNNADWLTDKKFLDDYLMEIASHFSMSELMKMETFQRKIQLGKPVTLLEFLYTTAQAWDFLELFEKEDCRIQVGGSDQWGNILQGLGLIHSHHGNKVNVQGITFELLTTPDGKKMGKTEKGPLWLDPKKTSPFDFYQYIEKTPDQMVGQLFKLFTFLEIEEIDRIVEEDPREAQKRLAFEVTMLVHGEKEAEKAQKHSEKLFSKNFSGAVDSLPELVIESPTLLDVVLIEARSLPSKSEVRRRCSGGAIKINGKKITDPKTEISENCTIQYGKSKFLNVKLR